MSLGFWKKLKDDSSRRGGVFVLAPMADVTDAAFRRIIAEVGKPDVMWTEFVSADGLALAPEAGRKKLLKNLEYSEAERPIVAQFFTSHPEYMKYAAHLASELGFDGVDINMGCPDKSIEKQGAGATLMKNPALARKLIRAAKDGANSLPVSVKTRTGYSRPELESWLPEILEEEPAVITVHARTRKEMSKMPAQWEFVKRAVEIRDEFALRHAQGKNKTLILGNGDVKNLKEARMRVEETGCDGVMLGRAIFGNPWLFVEREPSLTERLQVLVKHTKLFEELLACPSEALAKGEGYKNFAIMKKHFKAYVNEFKGAGFRLAEAGYSPAKAGYLRAELMQANNASEVERIVNNFILYLHHEKV
ncbi:MAG: tRNA-dihydrouridine synthase [Patescibacteria group bacterium]|nr:tRNA-dihydrouridine synthase [Patescibacteria group bacterium]